MGHPKHKWSPAEEEALRRGVDRYGAGKWKNIHQDPEFAPTLSSRSTVDLKDKWRNLSGSSGQTPRGKSKTKPKTKNVGTSIEATANTPPVVPVAQTPASLASSHVQMRHEPLSAHKQPNGIDCGAIADAQQTENIDMMKIDEQPETGNPLPKVMKRESQPMPDHDNNITCTIEQASIWAASMIADAENRSFVAAESMKEAERISVMAEEMQAMVQFARECLATSELPPT